ncbi:hypothetical protein [Aeoliella mucimassa]|uniref:hypothetical protein n=1 Tax=Aeoliella mucimassa TaxID=2527972 RepID=UPI0011A1257C|nr:hypothetical protein [Aeoliella mucimassa]
MQFRTIPTVAALDFAAISDLGSSVVVRKLCFAKRTLLRTGVRLPKRLRGTASHPLSGAVAGSSGNGE